MRTKGVMEMRTKAAKKFRGVFIIELVAILASLAVAYITDWRMPLSPWIAVPAGVVLWISGFGYTMHLRRRFREVREQGMRPGKRRGYPMVEARAAMHLGVALGFRSWPTLVVAVACAAVNLGLAIYLKRRIRDRVAHLCGWQTEG